MGKKWKRLLVQRRREQPVAAPAAKPVVSNSEMIERLKVAEAPAPEPEVVEEVPVVEEEPVAEVSAPAPAPKRRRTTRRKKTVSED